MATTGSRRSFLSWRGICAGLAILSCIIFVLQSAKPETSKYAVASIGLSKTSTERETILAQYGNWSAYNEAFDGLTSEECRTVFPALYHDIDRAVEWWQRHGPIRKEDTIYPDGLQLGLMRFLIYDNEFRVLRTQAVMESNWRIFGFTQVIHRAMSSALAARDRLPVVEGILNTHDNPRASPDDTRSIWSVTRKLNDEASEKVWLVPNFDYWWSQATGSFEDAKRLAMQYDHIPFAEKIPQIVWRGNVVMNPELRGALLDISKDKPWSNIIQVPGPGLDLTSNRLEEFQYCRYAMTVYTEGQTYSGRLTFLTNCKSLLFMPEVQWAMHFSHLLVAEGPNQNFVLVRRDWTDLEEKVNYYLAHPEEAEQIIRNMLSTFRSKYTTRAATSCYIRELVKGYAKVSFEPETHMELYDGEIEFPRGESYAAFYQRPWDNYDFENRTHVGE